MNPDTVKIDLLHHEFIKHRDHQKWLFYHIVLGPEQCFHLKSIHLERDEWKVRYYNELIIRTFEPSSIFVTLPPGISISQVVDKTQCCHLREAYACIAPSQRTPDVGTTKAIGRLRSVHSHYSAKDQVHHRPYPRANQRRIPRVPACYPPTLNLQHTTKTKNSSNLKRSNPLPTTTHRQKNRRLLTHQMNRQRRKPLTLLLPAALSPPVTPDRTLTSPQRTSRPYRTWRRQPVKEWPFMKRG